MQEILPQLVSGALVLSGVVVSRLFDLFGANNERKHKNTVLLREKYEEMTKKFQESTEYSGTYPLAKDEEEMKFLLGDHRANECALLCLLYFQELLEPLENYQRVHKALFDCVLQSYNRDNQKSYGEQALLNPNYEALSNAYVHARDKFISTVKEHAHKYALA